MNEQEITETLRLIHEFYNATQAVVAAQHEYKIAEERYINALNSLIDKTNNHFVDMAATITEKGGAR